ncbi:hypothetical protein OEZ85_006305 [Tetradesmus obliquus]|uniref:Uncharacterized protein n=1 Tax=Tetradesmus obliquus TaxID=3088 RepID=A0ABY8TU68_TETOB|nr:hypothetical protein OEZ85_006305 [Tetradesmus obliquus]
MDSHQHLEFIRGQGNKLLTSLPAAVRSRLRHYEVAAVMPFQPCPPLRGCSVPRCFAYVVVSDWSLLVVALSAIQEARILLELPLLLIDDVDVDALDVGDFANDSRGTQHGQQQQQQQQWGHEQDELLAQHSEAAAAAPDAGYSVRLVTVERASRLFFHIHKAWVSAHIRAALAQSNTPGLPAWLPPPANLFLAEQDQQQTAGPDHHQQQSSMSLPQQHSRPASPCGLRGLFGGFATPWATAAAGAAAGDSRACLSGQQTCSLTGSGCSSLSSEAQAVLQAEMVKFFGLNSSMWENDPLLDERISTAQRLRQQQVCSSSPLALIPLSAFTPAGSAISPSYAADCSKLMSRCSAAQRVSRVVAPGPLGTGCKALEQQLQQQQQQQQQQREKHAAGQRVMLHRYMQVGAGVYAQHAASATRELFWGLARQLLAPCSLFDEGDAHCIKQLVLELAFCRQQQLGALQQAFFNSSDVMSFLLARLTSWGALLALFPPGLPPIHNPAQPGKLEAWRGKRVLWAGLLMYPGRPRRLLRRLGLTGSSRVCFRSALNTAVWIHERHSQASAQAGSSSSSKALQDASMGLTYHADPLHLSPLADLAQVYPSIGSARRMLQDGSRGSVCDKGPSNHLLGTGRSPGADDDEASDSGDDSDGGSSSSSTMAEATVVLRWERLAGRLAAELAGRKLQLLLYWLQLQLSFTEGCSSRSNWLSGKALEPGPCPASLVVASPWSFRAATQQLLATLLTLRLPGCSQQQQQGQQCGLIPGGVEDLLWWAQAGADSWLLDHLVGVLLELSSMCEQEEAAGGAAAAAAAGGGLVMEVIRQVPTPQLHGLLRWMFVRLVCIMGGSAGSREWTTLPPPAAAVLAYKYGSVLLEVLEGVRGAAAALAAAFGAEVQAILSVPQVRDQMAAAVGRAGSCMLGRSSLLLLEEVLAAVGAAVPLERQQQQGEDGGLTVAALGHASSAMKVQN